MVASIHLRPRLGHLAAVLLALAGCRSLPVEAPLEVSGPGWSVREGQAVWKSSRDAAGVAGDLFLAQHADGRAVVRFSKTPLPFLEAQRTPNSWQLRVIPTGKTYRGRGNPPARLLWLHLPAALQASEVPKDWQFRRQAEGHWILEHASRGESLAGFLEAARAP